MQQLNCEVNFYLKDTKTLQGIGPHTDKERNIVIGICAGLSDRALCLRAFQGVQPVGDTVRINLSPGDMYAMCGTAKGCGSLQRPHIRHWATGGKGTETYLKRVDDALKRKLKKRAEKEGWIMSPQTKGILGLEEYQPRAVCGCRKEGSKITFFD